MTGTLPLDLFKGWLASGERGLSSEAIVIRLTGESWWAGLTPRSVLDHPWDPGDLRRCMKLLDAVPLARVSLPLMRDVSPQWAALVDHWDELTNLLTEEIPDILHAARANGGRAPRTYARMQDLLHNRPTTALAGEGASRA